jgi:hypothetical protein
MTQPQHTTACEECAFKRSIKPGYLGGSPPETYIGQINAPFWIPCHMAGHYKWKASRCNETQECAGAAIFRANLGISMPPPLSSLPPDRETVFATLAEFYAHHTGLDLAEAESKITPAFVEQCVEKELSDANVRFLTEQERRKA